MSSNESYFRLNPECFLVTGQTGSVIHNLYTGEAIRCDEAATAALVRSESNQPVKRDMEPYRDIERRGWGFHADTPPFVDKLRTFNVFREKRLWKETPYLAMAVLQVTNQCNVSCARCVEAFCPICKVLPATVAGEEPLGTGEWISLIDDLRHFGLQHAVFTGGEALLRHDLAVLVAHALARGIDVQVHTNGSIPLPQDFPPAVISVLLSDLADVPALVRNLGHRAQVTILASDLDAGSVNRALGGRWRVVSVSAAAPRLGMRDLMTTGFERFFARRLNDGCLNGKIYITHDGKALPCFGHRGEPIADVRRDGLSSAVKVLVESYWNVPVDQVDPARKCNRCEFRYCCTSCRFLEVDRQCGYDVECGTWRYEGHARESPLDSKAAREADQLA